MFLYTFYLRQLLLEGEPPVSAPDSDRLDEIERRLRVLEDIKEIEYLQHRYVRCLADRDWQGCVDCYADDAVCDIRTHGVKRGKKEIEQLILGELASMVKSRDAYVLSSPIIHVDGDRATGRPASGRGTATSASSARRSA
ncbi:MAG: hypothetical protein GEV03_11680 [Streptosporangiales bacterium]|nr:hypothetical protein [Streptosporangiales bacterium]